MTAFTEQTRAALMATAHALADAARTETLARFRQPGLVVDDKGQDRFDPVTEADRASETVMRALLAERRPQDSVFGEELADTRGSSGLVWMLDPLDGTRAFMSGAPTWGVLIALSGARGPLYGIIDQPYLGERFSGGFGEALLRGPRGIEVLATRQTAELADAVLYTTYPDLGTGADSAAFAALSRRVRLTRYGFDCYAYALLALGHVDLVVEAGLKPFDIQAPIAVIEAAGGIVTDWRGRPAHGGGQVIAAANATLHRAALEVLGPSAAA